MFDIVKIQGGFIFSNVEYTLDGFTEVLSDSQCHIGTDKGIILLDLSCTINGDKYTDINLFIQVLNG